MLFSSTHRYFHNGGRVWQVLAQPRSHELLHFQDGSRHLEGGVDPGNEVGLSLLGAVWGGQMGPTQKTAAVAAVSERVNVSAHGQLVAVPLNTGQKAAFADNPHSQCRKKFLQRQTGLIALHNRKTQVSFLYLKEWLGYLATLGLNCIGRDVCQKMWDYFLFSSCC